MSFFLLMIVVMGIVIIAETAIIVYNSGMLSSLGINPAPANKVDVIYIEGELVTDDVPGDTGYASSDTIVKEIRDAQDDSSVKAIVLRIDSPGGSPVAAEEIYEQVNETKQVKPVVVSMGDMAASAAYYISAPSTKIIADPDTFTGSIGVIWTFENNSGMYDKAGTEYYVAKSGPYKDVGADYRGLNDSEKTYVNGIVMEAYSRFVDAVASGRHLNRTYVQNLADGRVYTGQEAKDLGLVDETGSMYDAIDTAAQLGNISGTPDVTYENQENLYNLLFGGQSSTNTTAMQAPDGYFQAYYSPEGRIYE